MRQYRDTHTCDIAEGNIMSYYDRPRTHTWGRRYSYLKTPNENPDTTVPPLMGHGRGLCQCNPCAGKRSAGQPYGRPARVVIKSL